MVRCEIIRHGPSLARPSGYKQMILRITERLRCGGCRRAAGSQGRSLPLLVYFAAFDSRLNGAASSSFRASMSSAPSSYAALARSRVTVVR
jgi:hypothetical protein